jgi:hypothetical protein
MPSGLIDEKGCVGSWCDRLGDFGEVQVHGFGIAEGQDQSRALALFRADSTEDVGRCGSLIPGSDRASAALEPNFYLADVDRFFARDFIQAGWELFLKSSMAPSACA